MRLDQLPRSENVEDRRGGGSLGFPGGRAGGVGIGTLVLCLIIGWALGIDPSKILSEIGGSQQETQQTQPVPGRTETPSDRTGQFVSAVLGSTEAQWKEIFARNGKTYEPPTLVMFFGATRSGCGFAEAAMGPFYYPIDRKVYLDTSFFQGS
jgi:uncharacterized protein